MFRSVQHDTRKERGDCSNHCRTAKFLAKFFYSRVDTTSLNSILDTRKAPQIWAHLLKHYAFD